MSARIWDEYLKQIERWSVALSNKETSLLWVVMLAKGLDFDLPVGCHLWVIVLSNWYNMSIFLLLTLGNFQYNLFPMWITSILIRGDQVKKVLTTECLCVLWKASDVLVRYYDLSADSAICVDVRGSGIFKLKQSQIMLCGSRWPWPSIQSRTLWRIHLRLFQRPAVGLHLMWLIMNLLMWVSNWSMK